MKPDHLIDATADDPERPDPRCGCGRTRNLHWIDGEWTCRDCADPDRARDEEIDRELERRSR